MIAYVVGGAVLLAYVAYRISTPERRRRWLARINALSWATFDDGDPVPPSPLDEDARGHHHHHHDQGGDHGADFDTDGGHHH